MIFSEYACVKSRYEVVEKFPDMTMYMCADRLNPDHTWEVPLSSSVHNEAEKNFYIYPYPKNVQLTEEVYEKIKQDFLLYVKKEKLKKKIKDIKKDF